MFPILQLVMLRQFAREASISEWRLSWKCVKLSKMFGDLLRESRIGDVQWRGRGERAAIAATLLFVGG